MFKSPFHRPLRASLAWLFLLGLPVAMRLIGADAWRQAGFADFSRGTFTDAGANDYVSAAGRIQTVNRWDFNGDGYIDILCANTHPLVEMLPMSIYWGDGRDFSILRHSYVPADGPMWVAAGDFNRDGRVDLAVANYSNGTWGQMDSAIYWGGDASHRHGADPQWSAPPFFGKTMLPSQNAQGVAVADLNRDGWPDVIFAFSTGYWEYNRVPKRVPARIYWNRKGTFHRDDFTDLPEVRGATAVAVADLNGDGWPDLAFAIGGQQESCILFGGPDGFAHARRINLPTANADAVKIADINNDGQPDVLFANEDGAVSWAYLNRGGKFDPNDRIGFETHDAKDVVVADFNRDGYPDVFFTNHYFSLTGEERFGTRFVPSYLYWGGKDGFSSARRQEIQTIGAWGAAAADLNGDGWIDLVVCNFQEAYSYEVPSFIYWNGPQGFDVTKRTPIYEHGAQGVVAADFNGDGHPDLLFTSMIGGSRGDYDDSYLYIGNSKGEYSVDRRILLPGREADEQAMADLNDDGKVDVVLMNEGETNRYENEAWIYWNKDNQFDSWRKTGLPAYAGVAVQVADLDRDGYLDVIVTNNRDYDEDANNGKPRAPNAAVQPGSFIYWGGPDGFTITDRTVLNISHTRGPAIADVNGDGNLDLVFSGPDASIFFGDGTRDYGDQHRQRIPGTQGLEGVVNIADVNKDGYPDIILGGSKVMIYYGGPGAHYDVAHRAVVDVSAKTITIADVNGDGWLDVVCPLYKEGGDRSGNSSILLGGPNGYSLDRSVLLPTDGGTGAIVSDFNNDGYPDVFLYCHRQDGSPDVLGRYADHHTNSRLYWGSANGFDPQRYLPIPTVGAHYDMGVDLGRINDRAFAWDYISSPHDTQGAKWTRLSWDAVTPGKTAVRFQVRSAPTREALTRAVWQGPKGPHSYFTASGSDLRAVPEESWIQYKLVLDTFNGAASPVVSAVQIDFE